jgi:hypothetical protein
VCWRRAEDGGRKMVVVKDEAACTWPKVEKGRNMWRDLDGVTHPITIGGPATTRGDGALLRTFLN